MKTKLTFFIALIFMATASIKAQQNLKLKSPVWLLSGNKNTNPATNFLGTTDNTGLVFRTNNNERLRITQNGYVGIGTSNPLQKFDVDGNINIADGFGFYINNSRVLHTAKNGNIFVGEFTGNASISGAYNTGLGYAALYSNTSGYGNLALGNNTLFLNLKGYANTACGSNALYNNTSGFDNTAVGYAALLANTTGKENTATGYNVLASNISGYKNTASGFNSMILNTTGFKNAAYGVFAMYSNNTGFENAAFGCNALFSNTSGSSNTAFGLNALYLNSTANLNTAFGAFALYFNETGYLNTASGNAALYNNKGSYNTGFGANALSANTTGNNNTGCGYAADVNANTLSNSTALGHKALITASNQVRIGNSNVTSIGGYVGWTKISDGRVKKNIKENVPGLSFINKLKPITYNLNLDAADKIVQRPVIKDKDGKAIQPTQEDIASRKAQEQTVYTGFIAQDVEKAAKELNYDFSGVDAAKNDKDLYGLRYAEFVVPLVKAVQELSAKNDALEKRIEQLEALNTKDNSLAVISDASKFVKIYPNPVESILNVDFNKTGASQKTINIYDADGKLLITRSAQGNAQLNLKQLTAGAYLLKINDESGKVLYTGKVIKQ